MAPGFNDKQHFSSMFRDICINMNGIILLKMFSDVSSIWYMPIENNRIGQCNGDVLEQVNKCLRLCHVKLFMSQKYTELNRLTIENGSINMQISKSVSSCDASWYGEISSSWF
jgi:hypothetical protein